MVNIWQEKTERKRVILWHREKGQLVAISTIIHKLWSVQMKGQCWLQVDMMSQHHVLIKASITWMLTKKIILLMIQYVNRLTWWVINILFPDINLMSQKVQVLKSIFTLKIRTSFSVNYFINLDTKYKSNHDNQKNKLIESHK